MQGILSRAWKAACPKENSSFRLFFHVSVCWKGPTSRKCLRSDAGVMPLKSKIIQLSFKRSQPAGLVRPSLIKNRSLTDYLFQLLYTDNSVAQSTLQQFEVDYHDTTVNLIDG